MRIEVGAPFPAGLLAPGEGATLHLDREGAVLAVALTAVTEGERARFLDPSAHELALHVRPEALFVLFRIEGLIEWSDAPYSGWTRREAISQVPSPSPEGQGPELPLVLALVDAGRGVVRAALRVTPPRSFAHAILAAVGAQRRRPRAPLAAAREVADAQARLGISDLLAGAVERFRPSPASVAGAPSV